MDSAGDIRREVHSTELASPLGDLGTYRARVGREVEPAGDEASKVGHVLRSHPDPNQLRGADPQSIHVAVDRYVGDPDAAGERVRRPESLRRSLSTAPRLRTDRELM